MEYTTYTVKDSDRIDTIARECYGDSNAIQSIYEDNPSVKMLRKIPAGTVLKIRIVDDSQVQINENDTPPWKR